MTTIIQSTHPSYRSNLSNWQKFKRTFQGGKNFVNYYLRQFSNREDNTDFTNRKLISYCPAYAKAAILDIKNSIYQRMPEISRIGGSKTYQDACNGLNSGVDKKGRTMTSFIGTQVIAELLAISKIGIFVDKPVLPENPTKLDVQGISPYLYTYEAEEIRAWTEENGILTALLLKEWYNDTDEFGLTTKKIARYRYLKKTDDGIQLSIYNSNAVKLEDDRILELSRIPFVIGELSQSLLVDVADYQIALLNLESSDIAYSLKSNFPFYTEQRDPKAVNIKKIITTAEEDGTPARENKDDTGDDNIKVGSSHGRAYMKDMDRPGFIHPSSEPLKISIEKQDRLKQDIRKLVNLSLRNLDRPSGSQSADEMDEKGLEAGLSYIGLELERIENEISKIWAEYEEDKSANIKYPNKYSLKSDDDYRKEAKELKELKEQVPSTTFQKAISKEIASLLVGQKVSQEEMSKIKTEINSAKVLVTDHETIREDYGSGLVGGKLASEAAGYPDGEYEQAKVDHAERAARIADAQSKVANRGVKDLQNQDDNKIDKIDKQTRGKGATDE